MNSDLSEDDILNIIENHDLISESDIQKNFEDSCSRLQREKMNCVDIMVSQYLINNFRQIQLMNTLNHPTIHVFHYLINEINKLLKLPETYYVLDPKYISIPDESYKIPIFPPVIKYFNLDDTKFNNPPFYVSNNRFQTSRDFYLYFIRKIRN